MFSFTEKDLDGIAFLQPKTANSNQFDVDAAVARAHELRSEFFTNSIKSLVSKMSAKRKERAATRRAIAQLHSMSNRELADLGVSRSNIAYAVMGEAAAHTPLRGVIRNKLAALASGYKQWQQKRTGFDQLMSMDARQLSDIGLTRGDISAAVSGKGVLANDNYTAANDDGGRQVS